MALDNRSCITAATTRGGITFDQLCRDDQPYYVCDKECLVHDISNEDTLQKMEDKLVNKIEENFRAIEIGRDAKINKFYIGKTFVQKPKRSKTVIPTDPKSWTKTGISSRWGDHKKEDYGKDGMVVIAVITKDQVPLHQNGDRVIGQEHYTLALEQRLLHYYKITRKDTRLDNETFTSGGTDKKGSAAYALYVAFSLEPEANEDNSCIQNETREDESVEIDPNESNQVMDIDNLQHTPLVQPQSTVSMAQSTSVPLPQSTVSLPQSTLPLPQSTVSPVPAQSTVSLPAQSTVSLAHESTVSLAHWSTLPLPQFTLPAFNTVSYWLTTIEDTRNDTNNECLEEKQRENNDNESRIVITDDTEIHNNLSDLSTELGQSHADSAMNPQCPTHQGQLIPVNEDEDDDCTITKISHLTEQPLTNTTPPNTYAEGNNTRMWSSPICENCDGIQLTETPVRLNLLSLRRNRKRKYIYDTCSST